MNNALKPVNFKEANIELHPRIENPDSKSIRAFTDDKQCITCWKLTFWQRLSVLIFGRVWMGIRSGRMMPSVWLASGRTCFVNDQNTSRGKTADNGGVIAYAIIAICALLVAIGLAVYMLSNPPPMTGHISGKNYHPASYPVSADTPTVYVLTITSPDGKRACTWTVDEDTYNNYSVGDIVMRGVPGNVNDTAAAQSEGAG